MMWSEEDRSVVRRFGKPVAAACLVAALLGTAYLWHVRSNPTLSFRSLSVKNADGIQVPYLEAYSVQPFAKSEGDSCKRKPDDANCFTGLRN